MDHVKQKRIAELSTHGFTTVAKLKAMLKKLRIKLSKKSKLKAELIHILVEHEFANAEAAEATENNNPGEGKRPETNPGLPSCTCLELHCTRVHDGSPGFVSGLLSSPGIPMKLSSTPPSKESWVYRTPVVKTKKTPPPPPPQPPSPPPPPPPPIFESNNDNDDEHPCTYDPCGDHDCDLCEKMRWADGACDYCELPHDECECHDCQWCGGRKTWPGDYGENSDNEECSDVCRGANIVLTEVDVEMIMDRALNSKGENAWQQFEKWQRLDLNDFVENVLDLGEELELPLTRESSWGDDEEGYRGICPWDFQDDFKLALYERMKEEASERLGSMFYAIFILKKFARAWIEYCNAPGGSSYKKTRARFESMKKDMMPGGENKEEE